MAQFWHLFCFKKKLTKNYLFKCFLRSHKVQFSKYLHVSRETGVVQVAFLVDLFLAFLLDQMRVEHIYQLKAGIQGWSSIFLASRNWPV